MLITVLNLVLRYLLAPSGKMLRYFGNNCAYQPFRPRSPPITPFLISPPVRPYYPPLYRKQLVKLSGIGDQIFDRMYRSPYILDKRDKIEGSPFWNGVSNRVRITIIMPAFSHANNRSITWSNMITNSTAFFSIIVWLFVINKLYVMSNFLIARQGRILENL